MTQKIYVGVTKDNELYYLEIEPKQKGHDYFAMSGSTLSLLDTEEAEKDAIEQLKDGEYWKMAVESGNTTLGLDDWAQQVLDTDGWENQYDIDWDIGHIEVEDEEGRAETFYFQNSAGGQHEEHDFKHLFITEELRAQLMKLWKTQHLKDYTGAIPALPEQDEYKIAVEAAKIITADEE